MHRGMPTISFTFAAILASTVLTFAILATSLGCSRKPDDAKISSEIQSKYAEDSGLATKQLSVQTSNGVVTISGFVENDAQRGAAARQAAAVDGVKEVVNNLQVGSVANVSLPVAPSKIVDTKSARSTPNDNAPSARRSSHSRAHDAAARNDATPDSTIAENVQPSAPPQQDPSPNDASLSGTDSSAAPPPPAPASAPAPPQPLKVTIEQGTPVSVRLIDSIDSEKNQVGDTFHATLNAPLSAEGSEAIPAGADIAGHIIDLKSASKFAGQSLVVLQLDSISANGKTYSLQTDQFRKEGSSRGKNTAEKVGGGAILGGIIGALAGGGKGAAIGTAAGAGVGGGAQAASKSQQIKLPSETVLNFTLQAPVTVIKARDVDSGRPKLGDAQ
jgi:hypothetical protein